MTKKSKTKDRPRGGASVPCPACGGATHVLTTRRSDDRVTRKRQCLECDEKFETVESIHHEPD